MKTDCFDAAVDFSAPGGMKALDAQIVLQVKKVQASFDFYEPRREKDRQLFFVRVHSHQPLFLKWKDTFQVKDRSKQRFFGKGQVLSPFSEKLTRKKARKRVEFLQDLLGNEKAALEALTEKKGIRGLREKEMRDFFAMSKTSLLRLAQELEEEGKIRILSFAPLFLLSQGGLDFLGQKILTFLSQYHLKYPEHPGLSPEKIEKRFDLHPRIFALALKHLLRTGRVKEFADRIALSDFAISLTPEEKRILSKLDEMCLNGEMRLFSLNDLRNRFLLSSKKLDRLLSLLIEKRKVIQGKEGLLLYSGWLDEIIHRIRALGKRELTVQDFKEISGLSRKYAIPILELLDQMGVTRRKGSIREIL